MMSKKKKRSTNIILTIMLMAECVCMLVVSFSIWTTAWYNNHINGASDSVSEVVKDGSDISLCDIISVTELPKEDTLVKRTVPDDMGNGRYFLCTLEVENAGNRSVDYLTLQAKNQDEDDISCYPIDYYQDIGDASDNEGKEYHYGRMVFPEYTVSRYQVMLMLQEEQLKDMEELTIYEWGYDESEGEASNYVSSDWEDVLTSSPVQ